MIPGLELAFAIVPLVISATEHHQRAYRKARTIASREVRNEELGDFLADLHDEVALLGHTLRCLISDLTTLTEEQREQLLNLDRDQWKREDVSVALKTRLGDDTELAFTNILSCLLKSLDDVFSEKSLHFISSARTSSPSFFKNLEGFRKEIENGATIQDLGPRLHFTNKADRRMKNIKKVSKYNKRLERFVHDPASSVADGKRKSVRHTRPPTNRSRRLYQDTHKSIARSWSCSCLSHHEAKLSLLECLMSQEKADSAINLDMLVSMTSADQAKEFWLESRIRILPKKEETTHNPTVGFIDEKDSIESIPSSEDLRRSLDTESVCTLVKEAHRSNSSLELVFDGERLWQSRSTGSRFGPRPEFEIPLKTLLGNPQSRLTLKESRVLAVVLAHAFLHYCEIPWVSNSWNKNHVSFFATINGPDLMRPYLAIQFENSTSRLEEASDNMYSHPSPALLSLGILLLELYLSKPIESLWEFDDTEDGMEGINTNWITAEKLLDKIGDDLYEGYRNAIQACLKIDYADGRVSLDDEDFRKLVYERVVVPLEDELDDGFHITPKELREFAYSGSSGSSIYLRPARDSAYGSMESSLPTGSKAALSVDSGPDSFKAGGPLDKDDSGDIQSVLSVADDIQSLVSTHRTQQEIAASEQLGDLLARHEELSPLYEIALSKISKERLIGNLRRILKQYYLDLTNTARTNLEKAAVQLLRSRWDRIRISQQIADIIQPDTANKPELELSKILDIPDKKSYLESWLSNNPGFLESDTSLQQEDKHGIESSGTDNDDNDDSGSDAGGGQYSKINRLGFFPKIVEVEKFLTDGDSFQKLLMNLQRFLLPTSMSPLIQMLMAVPNENIWFSDKNDNSISNLFKVLVEDLTEENWHWWPFRPKMRMLQENETRVHWRCNCGTHLWVELSKPHAESCKMLLERRVRNPRHKSHICISKRRRNLAEVWKKWLSQAAGSSGWPSSRGQVPGVPSQQPSQSSSSPGLANKNNPVKGKSSLLAPSISTTRQNFQIPMNSIDELFVFFTIKGPRRTLELAQIKVGQQLDDRAFFEEVRIQYKKRRGFLRYWLSVWQLKDCELIKFMKVWGDRVLYTKKDLPVDPIYEYAPKPPMTELPHIYPHEFEMALLPHCKGSCLLSSFHDCVELRSGTTILRRIPKRKQPLQLKVNDLEEAWGLNAHYTPHFIRVFLYHCLVLAGTFAFWTWWLVTHPNDIQNASIPFTSAAAIIALFWSSLATLKSLR